METSSNEISKRRIKRMTKRQFKKKHLGPFTCLALRIRFELAAPITAEDCVNTSAFKRSSDWGPDDYLTEWFVDLVEKNGVYCYFGTTPVIEGTLTYEAFIEADGWGIKVYDCLMDFARKLRRQAQVKDLSFALIDPDRWSDDIGDEELSSIQFAHDLHRSTELLQSKGRFNPLALMTRYKGESMRCFLDSILGPNVMI